MIIYVYDIYIYIWYDICIFIIVTFLELFFTWQTRHFKTTAFFENFRWRLRSCRSASRSQKIPRKRIAVRSGVFHRRKDGRFSQEEKNGGIFQASTFFWGATVVVYVSNLYENIFFLVCIYEKSMPQFGTKKTSPPVYPVFFVLRWKWEKVQFLKSGFLVRLEEFWGRIPKMIWSWVAVSNVFYFHPYLGKIPVLTNIFQRGWNHQLGSVGSTLYPGCNRHHLWLLHV